MRTCPTRCSTQTRSVGSRDPLRLPRHLRRDPVAVARHDLARLRGVGGRRARGLRREPRAEAQACGGGPARPRLRDRHAPAPGPRVWPARPGPEPDSAGARDAARGALPAGARRTPREPAEALRRLGASRDVSVVGAGHRARPGRPRLRSRPARRAYLARGARLHAQLRRPRGRRNARRRLLVRHDAVVALARGADTLIHEATFPDRDRGRFGVHSTAGEAGAIAARAGVRRLILAHIEADYHDELEAMADEARKRFGGVVEIAREFVPYPL